MAINAHPNAPGGASSLEREGPAAFQTIDIGWAWITNRPDPFKPLHGASMAKLALVVLPG